jgi:hypothetical protein
MFTWRVTMPNYRQLMPALLGVAVLAGSMQAAIADSPNPSVSAPSSGMARIWFLRPSSPTSAVYGAAPEIYANGAAVGAIPGNAVFFRDFTPGTYTFTVQNYGLPNNAVDTVQLAPGTQTYLEVQSVPVWEEGYASGHGEDSHSFFVLNMSPQLAQAWIPALTDIGQR